MTYNWGSEIKKKGSDGMSNAAIETFKSGNILNSFIRELIQNSQDARLSNGKPLKIRVRLFSIQKSEIPAFTEKWVPIYQVIRAKWGKSTPGFFNTANELLNKSEIYVLEYSDFNTSGLSGNDGDDQSSFSACVLSEGNSVEKSDDAGGSYGIGKNSVFGLSKLRTVIYSSLNEYGEYIFQGVSKLASYTLDGVSYDSRIYLGQNNSELSSIRVNDAIPEVFRRKDHGLSQFVIGVDLNENWIEEIRKNVIDNYFVLLNKAQLIFELIDDISKENLILDSNNFKFFAEQDFNSSNYDEKSVHVWPKIRTLQLKPIKQRLKSWNGKTLEGGLVVHLNNDFEFGQNYIAYTRRGMQIYNERLHPAGGISYLNLFGVFYSENEIVNSVLRLMEPAAHDSWNKSLLKERIQNKLELEWAMNLDKVIKDFIRSNAKEFLKSNSSEAHSIEELDDIISSYNNPSSAFNSGKKRSGEKDVEKETALKTGGFYEVSLNFSAEEANFTSGEFLDKLPVGRPNRKPSGTKTGINGRGENRGDGKKNSKQIFNGYKCILIDESEFERLYTVVIDSQFLKTTSIEIFEAGDRNSKVKPLVISVFQDGKSLNVLEFDECIVVQNVNLIVGITKINVRIKSLSKSGLILQPSNKIH